MCLFLESIAWSVSSTDAQIFYGIQVHHTASNLQLHILLREQDYQVVLLTFDDSVVEYHTENWKTLLVLLSANSLLFHYFFLFLCIWDIIIVVMVLDFRMSSSFNSLPCLARDSCRKESPFYQHNFSGAWAQYEYRRIRFALNYIAAIDPQ